MDISLLTAIANLLIALHINLLVPIMELSKFIDTKIFVMIKVNI